jgi:hypothetical protein
MASKAMGGLYNSSAPPLVRFSIDRSNTLSFVAVPLQEAITFCWPAGY